MRIVDYYRSSIMPAELNFVCLTLDR